MRGAGCTINDMLDRNYDKRVARTRERPLAAGDLRVWPDAMVFLGAQLSAGLLVLTQLHYDAIALGAASLPLVVAYPLAKRWSFLPQLHLGICFNWGALLGYVAATGAMDPLITLPLYGGSICWTLVYDTLYAHQDKRDDEKLGLKSSALTLGDANTKPVLAVWSLCSVVGIGVAGHNAGLDSTFLPSLGLFASHLAWQITTADLSDPENLAYRFRSNAYVAGPILLTGIAASKLLA